MKSLRQIFELIAYAGMKPSGAGAAPSTRLKWLGPLRGPVDRFLNGPSSSDPFYLTNRTLAQKLRLWVLITLPFAGVVVLVYMAANGRFDDASQLPPPTKQLSNAEIAAKMLPDLNKTITLDSNKTVDVVDVVVQKGSASKVSGTVRNSSDQVVHDVELVLDLTDDAGSRVGAVTCKVPRIDAKSNAPFQISIPQHDAAFALVREIHNQ